MNFRIVQFILLAFGPWKISGQMLENSDLLCSKEFFKTGITLDWIDDNTPLFGNQWYTFETMFSNATMNRYKTFYSFRCKHFTPQSSCYRDSQNKFIRRIESAAGKKLKNADRKTKLRFARFLCLVGCLGRIKVRMPVKQLCPDPCSIRQLCKPWKCISHGMMAHQFTCQCPKSMIWDAAARVCVLKPIGKQKPGQIKVPQVQKLPPYCDEKTKCNPNGTLFCSLSTADQKSPGCVCKAGYADVLCSKFKDACQSRIEHPFQPNGGTMVSGNDACNVIQRGNRCIPYTTREGFLLYRCVCNEEYWLPDPLLPYPNCKNARSRCDSFICVNATCVTDNHGTHPICLCQPGYAGKHCHQWVGEWSNWSPWDRCRPACGDIRLSVRSRNCLSLLGSKRECLGPSIEYKKCDEHPCTRGGVPFLESYFALRQNSIASSLATAAVLGAIITVIWFYTCFGAMSWTIGPIIRRIRLMRRRNR